jgi:hypothetical protein
MGDRGDHSHEYVFVLWAEQFDERLATTFITAFRKLGLRVRVVGLDGATAKGRYGLGLVIDITLGNAINLAEQAICIILPCQQANLQRVSADPRLYMFLALAFAHKTCTLITWPDVQSAIVDQCPTAAESSILLPEDSHTWLGMAERIGTVLRQ